MISHLDVYNMTFFTKCLADTMVSHLDVCIITYKISAFLHLQKDTRNTSTIFATAAMFGTFPLQDPLWHSKSQKHALRS